MAYSNWGAFVRKDEERRPDREDVAVFNDDEKDLPSGARIFANLVKLREKYPDGNWPSHEISQHAVLGDGPIRLVGYKNNASLYELTDDGVVIYVDLAPFKVADTDDDEAAYEGEYKGCKFAARGFDGNMIDLLLYEADGSFWTARCGYLYGAGHTDVADEAEA